MRRRNASRSLRELQVHRPAADLTVPDDGGVSPTSTRQSVLLPEPDSPTSPTISPLCDRRA